MVPAILPVRRFTVMVSLPSVTPPNVTAVENDPAESVMMNEPEVVTRSVLVVVQYSWVLLGTSVVFTRNTMVSPS